MVEEVRQGIKLPLNTGALRKCDESVIGVEELQEGLD